MSWNNYDFKPDADKIDIPYTGDFDSYMDALYDFKTETYVRRAFAESEYSVTMDFVRFCKGVAKVKEREHRENKIDSIISSPSSSCN